MSRPEHATELYANAAHNPNLFPARLRGGSINIGRTPSLRFAGEPLYGRGLNGLTRHTPFPGRGTDGHL